MFVNTQREISYHTGPCTIIHVPNMNNKNPDLRPSSVLLGHLQCHSVPRKGRHNCSIIRMCPPASLDHPKKQSNACLNKVTSCKFREGTLPPLVVQGEATLEDLVISSFKSNFHQLCSHELISISIAGNKHKIFQI